MSHEVRGKNWTTAPSRDYPFPPLSLQTSQSTDLCLAQERVGQLDLGVVQNIKMLASLGQGDVQLFLETKRVKKKKSHFHLQQQLQTKSNTQTFSFFLEDYDCTGV